MLYEKRKIYLITSIGWLVALGIWIGDLCIRNYNNAGIYPDFIILRAFVIVLTLVNLIISIIAYIKNRKSK